MKTNLEWAQLYIEEVGKKYNPNIKIVRKSKSKLMKFLNLFARIFNKHFMTDYVTTIGPIIYVPDSHLDKEFYLSFINVIAHECVHIKQQKESGILVHFLKYSFPQCLALLVIPVGILGILFHSNLGWLGLVFLLFLLPLPAKGRYLIEREAYRVNNVFHKFVYGDNELTLPIVNKYVIENLSGPDYYFTWPWKEDIKKYMYTLDFLENEENIDPTYQDLINFLKKHNLTKEKE